ncbi:MAG: hypothetical protein PHD05_05170 [Sphaerochaetaceae bacterium]|nr:hypothetical protein [Sphaerochaetaceae bacterium]
MVSKKTVQLGVRVDKALMDRLSFFAKESGVDKMDLVRQAIAVHVAEMEKGYEEEAIEDYVGGRLSEKEFKEILNLSKVSEDLKNKRAETLEKMQKKVLEGGK